MNTTTAISKRISTRTFSEAPLSQRSIKDIQNVLDKANQMSILGTTVHFQYLNVLDPSKGHQKVGTYGIFKNQQGYVVGSCTETVEGYLDFSYAMEFIVIELTKLNLATCWVGGTFNKNHLGKFISPNSDHKIPAIVPLGYPTDKLRVIERIAKKIVNPRGRIDFDRLFYNETFKTPLTKDTRHYKALEMVRIAPSAVNKQTWRIVQVDNKFHFYSELDKKSYTENPVENPQSLDIGIALYHFHATLIEEGINSRLAIKNPEISTPTPYYTYYCTIELV